MEKNTSAFKQFPYVAYSNARLCTNYFFITKIFSMQHEHGKKKF